MNIVAIAACASSMVVLPAYGMQGVSGQLVPQLLAPTTGDAPRLVSAPAANSSPGSALVALAPITETAVLTAPVPTISPTWGYRVAVIGSQVFATGPERAMSIGSFGQICVWDRASDGAWKANITLSQLSDAMPGDYGFQRLERGGPFLFTAVNRNGLGTSLRVLTPRDGQVKEVATVALPAGADIATFGSWFASDGATLAVSATDMRFNLGAASADRERDPKTFIYSNRQGVWNLDGFVRAPSAANGVPTEAMWFGTSLDVDGDVLAIGRPATIPPRQSETMPISGTARVHVYRRMSGQWMPEAEILGASVTDMKCFGLGVMVEGDLLIVRGMDPDDLQAPSRVWLFARIGGTWTLRQELVPQTGIVPGRAYGFSMAISKGHIVLGDTSARGADELGEATPGMALVFEERDGQWINTKRLMPAAPCAPRSFGNDVAADWPIVVVGRAKNTNLGLEPGGAYVFDFAGDGQAVSPRPQ